MDLPTLFNKLMGRRPKQIDAEDIGRRTAIKTQAEPELLPYSPEEQALIDRFEAMPRSCRRSIEHSRPKGWMALDTAMDRHPKQQHKH